MKSRYFSILFAVIFSLAFCVLAEVREIRAQQADEPAVQPQKATLLAHHKYNSAKASFNFEFGVRVDSKSPLTHNQYGGITLDGDSDWFEVPMGRDSRSQLKDLGELTWAEIYYVPILPASSIPHNSGMGHTHIAGKMVSTSPEGVLVKAAAGHIYLLHSKHDQTDLYVMFRVDALKAGDECSISWKIVPSPEGEQQ
jgi:hypothetical protein